MEKNQRAENFRLTKGPINKRARRFFSLPWVITGILYLGFFACLFWGLSGCATNPPPPLVTQPTTKTLSFQIFLNDAAKVSTQFTENNKTFLGTYRIIVNTLNPNLIGNNTVLTSSTDTWTDYFQYDITGWTRNHRIALPNSQQPQQWTGFQAITPGAISASQNSFTVALSTPDQYLGNATSFLVSVITYIAPQSNPANLHAIDALGPQLNGGTTIDYIAFNSSLSNQNSKADSGGLGDWLAYPLDFPDLTNSDYTNFDIKSMTVILQ